MQNLLWYLLSLQLFLFKLAVGAPRFSQILNGYLNSWILTGEIQNKYKKYKKSTNISSFNFFEPYASSSGCRAQKGWVRSGEFNLFTSGCWAQKLQQKWLHNYVLSWFCETYVRRQKLLQIKKPLKTCANMIWFI